MMQLLCLDAFIYDATVLNIENRIYIRGELTRKKV